jgi:hypothetical protein
MLKDLVDNTLTDKNTIHSYLDVYEELFKDRTDITDLLEIGIDKGGSLKLWSDYFKKANICAMDIDESQMRVGYVDRLMTLKCDAYDKKNIPKKQFDIIIDDGPHTFISVIKFLFYYLPLLKDDGILIIEDVQVISCIEIFEVIVEEHFPELKKCCYVKDLREVKGRYDDIMFIVDKRKLNEI